MVEGIEITSQIKSIVTELLMEDFHINVIFR